MTGAEVLQRCVADDTPCGTPQRAIVASFRRTLYLVENDRLLKGDVIMPDQDGNVLRRAGAASALRSSA